MILEELRREKIPFNTFFDKDTLDKKFALFNVKDVDELYLYVGQGKYSPKSVIGKEEVKQEDYYKIETYFGKFSRSFTLPDNVDIENIEAKSDNGVLEIVIPKLKDDVSKKSIEIK